MQDITIEVYKSYEAELAAIAALDRAYYLNATPTSAERAEYSMRQDHLEQQRARFYDRLSTAQRSDGAKPRLFRVVIDDCLMGRPVVSASQCMLTHDLNNQLGVVIGHCQLLADFVSENTEASKHLSLILDAVRNMAGRIRGSVCPME